VQIPAQPRTPIKPPQSPAPPARRPHAVFDDALHRERPRGRHLSTYQNSLTPHVANNTLRVSARGQNRAPQRRTLRSNDTRTKPTTEEPSVNTSATLPSTIQIRASRLAGLLVAVAIVTGVTTWSVSQVTTESHAPSSPQSDVVSSPGSATKADDVTALTLEQRAAIYGNVYANQSQQRLDAEAKLGINLDDFDKAEQDFLIALAAGGELVTTLTR